MLTPGARWGAFWVCASVTALTILDLTKVNVALPVIEHSLGSSSTELQLIVSGYVLTIGLFLVPAGRIGDLRSRRLMYAVGLTIFAAMSLLCALAVSSQMLFIARIAQGVGAGILMPQALGVIQTLFQGADRAKAFGYFGVVIGIAMAFGPAIGGLALEIGGDTDGWRAIFGMNVPLALIALILILRLLPRKKRTTVEKLDLDPLGLLLLSIAVVALLWPFLFTTGMPSDEPARWLTLVLCALVAPGFVWWEHHYQRRGRQPLVYPGLFRIRSYRNGMALACAYFAANPVMQLLTTLFLQQGVGLSPLLAGLVSACFALMTSLAAWWGGRLITRYGRPLVIFGLVILLVGIAGLVLAAHATPQLTPWLMAGAMLVCGVGGGFVMMPNQTLTLAEVPIARAGVAGSVAQLGQRIGGSVGSAIGLSLFYSLLNGVGVRENPDMVQYQLAYSVGMLVVVGFITVALVVACVDASARRKDPK